MDIKQRSERLSPLKTIDYAVCAVVGYGAVDIYWAFISKNELAKLGWKKRKRREEHENTHLLLNLVTNTKLLVLNVDLIILFSVISD